MRKQMKIYIALAKWDYDYNGTEIIGVFDSAEKAQECCDTHKYPDGILRGDRREFEEFELNKITPYKFG